MNEVNNTSEALQNEDTQHGRFMTFRLAEEEFAVEIKNVVEIINVLPITVLPEAPDFVKGVINLRNKIIPVVDMRLKLHMEPIDYTERTCIVIIDIGGMHVGLIVDRVLEVITISDGNIEPPPMFKINARSRFLKGIGKVDGKIKLILCCEKLLSDEEMDELNAAIK